VSGTHAPQPIDVHTKQEDMTPVEKYAIDLIVNGARSFTEDDLDEDGKLSEDDHREARALALRIVKAIRSNPQAVLALVA